MNRTGQDRGNHEHEREDAGGTSFDSEDSGSFPSSDDSPGGRYVVVATNPISSSDTVTCLQDCELCS